jgi:hypothetical protein
MGEIPRRTNFKSPPQFIAYPEPNGCRPANRQRIRIEMPVSTTIEAFVFGGASHHGGKPFKSRCNVGVAPYRSSVSPMAEPILLFVELCDCGT